MGNYNHVGIGYHIHQNGKPPKPRSETVGADRVEKMLRLFDEGDKAGLLAMAAELREAGHHTAALVIEKKVEAI